MLSFSLCSEIEFKLRFGCNVTHIDQGVRLEVLNDIWEPIRFYSPTLTAAASPSVVTLLQNNSVRAEAATYISDLPIVHLNTTETETVTIREYLCGRYISLIRNQEPLRLRWMQRYRTNPAAGAATWSLDDIRIRIWNGDCFAPVLVEDFSSLTSTRSTTDGLEYGVAAGGIAENFCGGASISGNSALYLNRVGTESAGVFRRSFLIRIVGYRIGSCGSSNITLGEYWYGCGF